MTLFQYKIRQKRLQNKISALRNVTSIETKEQIQERESTKEHFYLLALVQMTAASWRLVCNAVTRSSSCYQAKISESTQHLFIFNDG